VATDKPKVYVDAPPIIDLVKFKVGVNINPERERDAWHLQRMLEAARDGKVEVFTSALSIAECVHVEDQNKLEKAKPFFMGLLASGRGGFLLIQPTLAILEKARNLRWINGLSLKGADAAHAASALQFHCGEFWSRDNGFAQSAPVLKTLGIHVRTPSETALLPDEYRQESLGIS
jgi:predicted nucleic acid-binding protein